MLTNVPTIDRPGVVMPGAIRHCVAWRIAQPQVNSLKQLRNSSLPSCEAGGGRRGLGSNGLCGGEGK